MMPTSAMSFSSSTSSFSSPSVPASPALSAGGPAARPVLPPPPGDGAVAAVAGLHLDFDLVDEFQAEPRKRKRRDQRPRRLMSDWAASALRLRRRSRDHRHRSPVAAAPRVLHHALHG